MRGGSFLEGLSMVSLLLAIRVIGDGLGSWLGHLLHLVLESREAELADAEGPVEEDGCSNVEDNVGPEDTEVAPDLAVVDVAAGEQLACVTKGTVCTVRVGVGVLKVAR